MFFDDAFDVGDVNTRGRKDFLGYFHLSSVIVGEAVEVPCVTLHDPAETRRLLIVGGREPLRHLAQPVEFSGILVQNAPAENAGSPPSKVNASRRMHPIADRDDSIEIVVLDASSDIARAFTSNYPEIPDGCLTFELVGPVRHS